MGATGVGSALPLLLLLLLPADAARRALAWLPAGPCCTSLPSASSSSDACQWKGLGVMA